VITLGGRRIFFAGVTECVPEVRDLKAIDIAFMPMNIPVERMMPADAAACTKAIAPKVVYLNHYDQDYASRATNPRATPQGLPGGITVAQSLEQFRKAMEGSGIEFRDGAWYPQRQ
jgi:L-ascorbate metabolism protein UlaG (beta-lactamase superfamily)